MANIALNKPSGGQLILSPEDGTSTETVTIPSVGVGKVLQVVGMSTSTQASTSSATWTDVPNFSLSITPTSATSKILVLVDGQFGHNENTQTHSVRLLRDSNYIYGGSHGTKAGGGSGWTSSITIIGGITYLDSPATTSTVTYKLQYYTEQTIMYFNKSQDGRGYASSITLVEVAA